MTATGHALIGAAIATQIPNPYVSYPVILASHFLADKLPHWDPMTNKAKSHRRVVVETVLDVLIGYALVWLIFIVFLHFTNPVNLFLAAFVSQLPDWMEFPYAIFRVKIPFVYENYRIQKWVHDIGFNSRLAAPWGVVTQVVVVLAFLVWVIRK